MSPIERLDPELSAFVANERLTPTVLAPAVEARLQQRLAISIAAVAAPLAAASAFHRGLALGKVRWPLHLVTVVASGLAGAGIHAVATRPHRSAVPAEIVAPAIVPPAPIAVAPAAPVIAPAPLVIAAERPAKPREETHDSSLANERVLIETARSALMRDRSEQALEALKRHAHDFPRGRLSEERDSLRVQALANLGAVDEARMRAAQFEKTYPTSLLTPMVQAAVQNK